MFVQHFEFQFGFRYYYKIRKDIMHSEKGANFVFIFD